MAKIEDLIRQISDEKLRDELASEVRELKKRKRFGLVFEEHLPEMLRLPKAAIRVGNVVAHRNSSGSEVWRVIQITGKKAKCRQPINPTKYDQEVLKDFPLDELVLVVSFGEPIYPVLTPIDRVDRGGLDKPWHVIINADNYHALQLLLYSHERKIDLIYIDPPYNTGAKDWKYNNDYVDKTDAWRHSKWLSMMKKRLVLAKRLLKPNGILICAIDDRESHHLEALLNDVMPSYDIGVVAIESNPKGSPGNNLSRSHDYAIFAIDGGRPILGEDPETKLDVRNVRRSGKFSRRHERRPSFYPIYVKGGKAIGYKGVPPDDFHPPQRTKVLADGSIEVWPIDKLGHERRWSFGLDTIEENLPRIYTKTVRGEIQLYYNLETKKYKTIWSGAPYDAGKYGTELVQQITGVPFTYPKSLYTVVRCLQTVLLDRKDAIVCDFFGGSGTTLHATALLNSKYGGRRQCILVTNNEVDERQAKRLREQHFYPGDPGFEKHGICESVTWPRCKYAIQGHRDNGTALDGAYLDGTLKKEGFRENIAYFRLDFVDPTRVERGDAFEGVLPILWMMAGAIGERESRRGSTAWYLARHSPFAVLIRETKFHEFQEALSERKDIHHVFLVTDSDDNFAAMRRELGRRYRCVQLYKSYLENFRINAVDRRIAANEEEPA